VIPKNDPSLVASRSESASTQSKAD
jgi:hypothetical protein